MFMTVLMGALAFLGGVLNTVQSGSNATLAKTLHQPILAAMVVACASTSVFVVVGVFYGIGLPNRQAIAAVPWWAWIGGMFGAVYVLVSIFFAEKLGAGIFIGLTVTAGVITSITIDHFGLVGFKQHTANIPRLIGGALMIAGLTLVAIF